MHVKYAKPGNVVRLYVEGTIIDADEGERWVLGTDAAMFRLADGRTYVAPVGDLELIEGSSIEDLQIGDVVQDSDGFIYQRLSGCSWQEFGNGDVLPDHEAVRPLTLLVRDGKVVTSE